jgi:hypothetical protein
MSHEGWIPVDERLPETGESNQSKLVLVYGERQIGAGWYIDKPSVVDNEPYWRSPLITCVGRHPKLTHWMPFPAPPKPGNEQT